MAGTKEGSKKTAETNKLKYGEDYYARIGAEGGKAKVKKGFAVRLDLASAGGKSNKKNLNA